MGITLSQSVLGGSGDPPNATAFLGNVPKGDVIVCSVFCVGNGTLGTISVAESVNTGSYTQLVNYQDATNGSTAALYYIVANTAGTPTVTATCSTPEYGGICIADFTGFTGTITSDAGAITTARGSSGSVVDTPVTNAFANELMLATAGLGVGWASAPATWNEVPSTFQTGMYYAVIATASQNTPFSGTLGSTGVWDIATAGLYGKVSSGGTNMLLLGV